MFKKIIAVILTTLILTCSVAFAASAANLPEETDDEMVITLVLGKNNANTKFYLEQDGNICPDTFITNEKGTLETTISISGTTKLTSEIAVKEMSAEKKAAAEENKETESAPAENESEEEKETESEKTTVDTSAEQAEKQAKEKKQFIKRTVIFALLLVLAVGYLVFDKFFNKKGQKKSSGKNRRDDDDDDEI